MTAMTDALKQRWDRVAQRLRAELGEDLYSSWFARMELEDISSGRLTVSVPTRFLKSWIETHYVSRLHKIGESELGQIDSVQVRVRSNGTAARPLEQPERRPEPQAAAPVPATALQQVMAADKPVTLDPNQTFDTFVVGSSNQLAHAAVCRVADAQPGSVVSFNPLFIHAQSGLGKTHLLSAVAHRIRACQPSRKVLVLTAERFMYSFVVALRQRDTISFKDQFQSVDVLLIDDFQFLQGKTMQQEFCHAFNSLVDSRRQVIVAADVPPAQLDAVDQRMRSRLMGGLVVDIELPDLDLRRRILLGRYEQMLRRDPSVTDARRCARVHCQSHDRWRTRTRGRPQSHHRLSAVQPVAGHARSGRDGPARHVGQSRSVARQDRGHPEGRRPSFQRGPHRSPVTSPCADRRGAAPDRHVSGQEDSTARSLPEIGRRFGGRDHSTVLHAVRKIEDQIKTDDKLAREVALLIRLVEQG